MNHIQSLLPFCNTELLPGADSRPAQFRKSCNIIHAQIINAFTFSITVNKRKERNLNGPIEETLSFVRRELIFRKDHYELCDKFFGILGNIEIFLQELEY